MTPAKLIACLRPTLPFPNFSTRQLAILLHIAESGCATDFCAIWRDLPISKPAASRNIDALCILGFVDRDYSETDRRKVFVNITPRGRDFVESMGVS